MKYLVQWKGFIVEHDSWEKEKDLENAKEIVTEFKRRINTDVRRQERLDWVERKDFRRRELPGRYTTKMLCRWDDGKFKDKYLKKLEKNWRRWKGEDKMKKKDELTSSSRSRNLEGRVISEI